MSGLQDGLYQAFINWLYTTSAISIPESFHDRCALVESMLDNDVTGLIDTILDYSINSASEAQFKVESDNNTLEDLLNLWLNRINININGVPTGLQELSREYFKERWSGSSLCLLRATNWKEITIGQNSITVPTVLWFANGASIYVKRPKDESYKLGSDKYYIDFTMKSVLPSKQTEDIFVQKPFDRWFDQYPTPYLVRKGVLKNYLIIQQIQKKADEVISKVLPYLFTIEKGTENLFNAGVNYTDEELTELVDQFKQTLERYKTEQNRTPINAIPFDQKYNHLIPDLRNILTEELYRQGYRALLAGLGFVDVIQGVSSTRKESVLNPKPFVAEVNAGVNGFKSILLDIINTIIKENKVAHRKLFSDNNSLTIVSSPIKINTEAMLDMIRSAYDRGPLSIQTYIETLGFDFKQEKERRTKEAKEGDENIFYPHLIQNKEGESEDITPSKPKEQQIQEKNEDQDKKKGTPEVENFKI